MSKLLDALNNTVSANNVDCAWTTEDPLYVDYHNNAWGRPVLDSKELFAKLCLDGQQAGLSWLTILKKQRTYEQAYANFEPQIVSHFNQDDIDRLMLDSGIVRNKLKIQSVIKNAKGFLDIEKEMPFNQFIWQFTHFQIVQNSWTNRKQVPTASAASDAMSKALKKAGFSFVGSTICYAFMQAVGMVNDHLVSCPCHAEIAVPSQHVKAQLGGLSAQATSRYDA
jgi:DNA-3-methyladenine glycosylase I